MKITRIVLLGLAAIAALSFSVWAGTGTIQKDVSIKPEAFMKRKHTLAKINHYKLCESSLGLTDSQKKDLTVAKKLIPGHPYCCKTKPMMDDERLECLKDMHRLGVATAHFTVCNATAVTLDSSYNLVFPDSTYCGAFSSGDFTISEYVDMIKNVLHGIRPHMKEIAAKNN